MDDFDRLTFPKPKTKIVATIGPSTWEDQTLKKMISYGMTVARINASFADHAELERVSTQLRKLSDGIGIMLDTQGHKIRINKFEGTKTLEVGQIVKIGNKEGDFDIWVDYKNFLSDIQPSQTILLDDGTKKLTIKSIENDCAMCEVVIGGELLPLKTVNLPDSHLSFPPLSEKDKLDIEYAIENNFEYIAASFIRNTSDVDSIKKLIGDSPVKIIAKIENSEGVENFDSILRSVDGIMIARGDLGVELEAQKVPALQKKMIKKCRSEGKVVIVATQMMESMRENSRPTRAEVSDVANAVFDGCDAVMLSAETSTGKYPSEAVEWMAKICIEAENSNMPELILEKTAASIETDSVCRCALELSYELPISKIVIGSKSGLSVMSVARHRPNVPIIAFVNSKMLSGQLNLVRGVIPVFIETEFPADRDWLVRVLSEYGVKKNLLNPADLVVLLCGSGVAGKYQNSILEVARVFDVCNL
ncbi:pyruvate kinase [Candidatus Dojkabacteria bacterium]|nr:pyruvate kinase [Candidatus Dojkabacteria bacterium]